MPKTIHITLEDFKSWLRTYDEPGFDMDTTTGPPREHGCAIFEHAKTLVPEGCGGIRAGFSNALIYRAMEESRAECILSVHYPDELRNMVASLSGRHVTPEQVLEALE